MINNLEVLRVLLSLTRRIGKTTCAIELATLNNATLICTNNKQAKQIAMTTGLQTVSIYDLEKLRGSTKPVIVDQDALLEVLYSLLHADDQELAKGIRDLIEANPSLALTSSSKAIRDIAEGILNDNS